MNSTRTFWPHLVVLAPWNDLASPSAKQLVLTTNAFSKLGNHIIASQHLLLSSRWMDAKSSNVQSILSLSNICSLFILCLWPHQMCKLEDCTLVNPCPVPYTVTIAELVHLRMWILLSLSQFVYRWYQINADKHRACIDKLKILYQKTVHFYRSSSME